MKGINLVIYSVEEAKGLILNNEIWYIIGFVLAVLLLGYLLYSVLRPEDF